MPVEIGFGGAKRLRPGVRTPSRFSGPRGFHPGALWVAAAAPVLATLLLLARLTD